MQIKMFSDTICGWCYIGKERLNQALEQLNLSTSIVTNLPFQLNPSMPKDGMERINYIKSKFGSIENAKPMYDNMIMQGEQENLQIKLDKIQRTPNTVKSHLLVDFARKYKVENDVITDLFENYFAKAKDIGDEEVLVSIAKKNKIFAGIHNASPEYAKKMLNLGFNLVTIGSDQRYMSAGAKDAVSKLKSIKSKEDSKAY